MIEPVNQRILDGTIRHAVALEQLKTAEVRRLVRFLNEKVEPDLVTRLVRHLGRGTMTEKRLKELKDAVTGVTTGGYARLGEHLTERLQKIGLTEAEWNQAMLQWAMPAGIAVDLRAPHVGILKASLAKSRVQGELVQDLVKLSGQGTARKVMGQIHIGLTQGEGIDRIVRRIRGTRARGYADGILNTSRRNIEAIVRTSISDIVNRASEAVYEANRDVVKGVQIVATLDTRTTDICIHYDGQVFDVSQGPRPPFHYGCRTRTVPVLRSWRALGIRARELEPGTRASMDGQVSEKLTYNAWLKKQPAAVQDEVLGTTRGRLYREGKVKIDRFSVDGRRLTLEDLRKREGLSVKDIQAARRGA
jgi:SPP1 gp7 family putative phage head morphogenesis protein